MKTLCLPALVSRDVFRFANIYVWLSLTLVRPGRACVPFGSRASALTRLAVCACVLPQGLAGDVLHVQKFSRLDVYLQQWS